MKPEPTRTGFRIERDPIGEKQVRNAITMFDEKCVRLIKAHPQKLREYSERTVGRAALYNEERGFMGAAELAQEAIDSGKSIEEVIAEE